MKDYLDYLLQNATADTDSFDLLSTFYHEKNKRGFGLFSTLAGENFPHGWVKAIDQGIWPEKGEYGDNFRKVFNLSK